MRMLSRIVVIGFIATLLNSWSMSPAVAVCRAGLGIGEQQIVCHNSGAELQSYMLTAEGSAYSYRFSQLCADEGDPGLCDNPRACNVGIVEGTLYSVLRRPIVTPGADFEAYAVVCLTAGEEDDFDVISWQRVWAVMKTMDWPQADMVVQPVGGRTLINFETNFFTTTTEARVQPVRLGDREVEIEATPESYTWHWGDGSGADATDEPGAEHQDGRPHEVFHVYTDAGVKVRPSVDVTYGGRYRVEGGQWLPIPQTLTVEGDPVALEVVSARVQLVG